MDHPQPDRSREAAIRCIEKTDPWDVLVIGGGATGLGTALDAASRGHRTLLLERDDFGKGTSSRSTKLVHGGVRYLASGQVSLVTEALRERRRLLKNAPHLVQPLNFILPAYRWWELPYYGAGLKLYDGLSRWGESHGLERSRILRAKQVQQKLPGLKQEHLVGGIMYSDGQFDDAGLLISLLLTLQNQGGWAANYCEVFNFEKEQGRLSGVMAKDHETGNTHLIRAKVVVNATGVFTDRLREEDEADVGRRVQPSQGAHVVLPVEFLGGREALIIPKTADGRVLFAIPWHGTLLAGTTDTPIPADSDIPKEPTPFEDEVDFILAELANYLLETPKRSDVLSAFAGLRPLICADPKAETKHLSREHEIEVSSSGLISVMGGKWTTYRSMAEQAVDRAQEVGALEIRPSRTKDLALVDQRKGGGSLQNRIPTQAEIEFSIRQEMARTVEDMLARRSRLLFLDTGEARRSADETAQIMARELGRDPDWTVEQVEYFTRLANQWWQG